MKKDDIYARMMHTPDDPARAELRAALREVRTHLLPLHRTLIESAGADYGANVAPVAGPTHLLQLLQEDPFFAWLKPMTSLIVEIDTMVSTDFERSGVDAVVQRMEHFFGNNPDADFSARYVPILQRDVDVAIAHAAIRQLLGKLQQK